MTPENVPITARRNVPFVEQWLLTDDLGAGIDFSAYSAKLQVRLYGAASGSALFTLNEVSTSVQGIRFTATAGELEIRIDAATISALPSASEAGGDATFYYDLVLTDGDGLAEVFTEGKFIVKPGVTI